ncbi:MAG: hypothetical protein ACI9TH_004166 [Kiritimatiellia bacterium]|jgi:hypothetical protein
MSEEEVLKWGRGNEPASPQPGDPWEWHLPVSEGDPVTWVWCWIPPSKPGETVRLGARGWNADEEPAYDAILEQGCWMLETPVTQRPSRAAMVR